MCTRFIDDSDLSMRQYHEIADATMENLTDTLEALQEEIGDEEFDIEYSVRRCFSSFCIMLWKAHELCLVPLFHGIVGCLDGQITQ
jgi:hypothetical protein